MAYFGGRYFQQPPCIEVGPPLRNGGRRSTPGGHDFSQHFIFAGGLIGQKGLGFRGFGVYRV